MFKTWSKDYNPLLSVGFRADVCIMALKIWLLGTIDTYLSVLLDYSSTEISLISTKVIVGLILALGSTLYFLTFSDSWKPYFEEFEKLSTTTKRIRSIIVWSIIVFIFLNVFVSVELAKKLNG